MSTVPSRTALKMPEVADAIRAECDAMPMACNQWTIDVHDQLLSKLYRQLLERHATVVPGLPRKPWVTEAVSKLLFGACGGAPVVPLRSLVIALRPPSCVFCGVGRLSQVAAPCVAPVSASPVSPSLPFACAAPHLHRPCCH